MTVLATYNIKGGVGKTSTAVNLAYLAARDGARTLLWDLDPQGASTFLFRIRPKVKGGGKKLVRLKTVVADQIKGTDHENLDRAAECLMSIDAVLKLNPQRHFGPRERWGLHKGSNATVVTSLGQVDLVQRLPGMPDWPTLLRDRKSVV